MNISKRTAERMLQNIDKRLQALAMEQQSMNKNKGGKHMSKGGRVKMPDGDVVPFKPGYTNRWTNFPYGFGNDPYMVNFGLKPFDYNPSAVPKYSDAVFGSGGPKIAVSDDKIKAFTASTKNLGIPQLGKYGTEIGKFSTVDNRLRSGLTMSGLDNNQGGKFDLNSLMQMAPTIFNGIAGLTSRGPDKLKAEAFQNPYESESYAMMPSEFRIDDILDANRSAYATHLRNVNQVGNSRGERMANYTAGMNRMNESNTKAYALKNNVENELRTNKAQLRNYQGILRANTNLKVRDMNDANAAAARTRRSAYLASAAEGLQNYSLTKEQMRNQTESQRAYLEAMKQMPFWSQWLGLDKYTGKKQ